MNSMMLHSILHGIQDIYCGMSANIRNAHCGHGYSGYTACGTFHVVIESCTQPSISQGFWHTARRYTRAIYPKQVGIVLL